MRGPDGAGILLCAGGCDDARELKRASGGAADPKLPLWAYEDVGSLIPSGTGGSGREATAVENWSGGKLGGGGGGRAEE